ncbi:MAG: hypothetical protein RL177_1581 [Bacteroidota bacterium]|jgi:predicted O-methyltransferase YrrM
MSSLNALYSIAIKKSDQPLIIILQSIAGALLLVLTFMGNAISLYAGFFLVFLLVISASIHTHRMVERRLVDHQRQVQSLNELTHLLPLRAPLPPLTGWAASPELLTQILMIVKSHQPTSVLELGSGASTIAIPYMLERWGQGSMISIDHDADFAEKTRHNLSIHEHQNISLHHCALRPVTVNGTGYRWYDLSQVTLPHRIDLLIVDGPPLQTNPLARYPALPLLWDRLSDGAIILMDDTDRADEQEIVRRWMELYPITILERQSSLKGFLALKVRKAETRSQPTTA